MCIALESYHQCQKCNKTWNFYFNTVPCRPHRCGLLNLEDSVLLIQTDVCLLCKRLAREQKPMMTIDRKLKPLVWESDSNSFSRIWDL